MRWVGNKNSLKPQSPYNGLHLFDILKGWRALYLIKQLLGQHLSHLTKGLPKPTVVLDLELSVGSPSILSSKACRVPCCRGKPSHALTMSPV